MVKIALVGEAYGAQEELQGKPFVGKAGRMLDECLSLAQLPRSACHVTNVFNVRPPDNDVTLWLNLAKKDPETEFYREHREKLKEELLQVKPNVVCALGAVPLYALTGLRSIMKYRGSILESTLIPGLKVVPTIHPAAALRQYIYKHIIVVDLKRVKEESESPLLNTPERRFIVEPTLGEVREYIEECKRAPITSFDIETLGQNVSCIGLSCNPETAICIPFMLPGGKSYWSLSDEMEVLRILADFLSDPQYRKVAQNGIFDVTFLAAKFSIVVRGYVADTMFTFNLLYPDFPKGLDFIASVCTREPYYKDEGKHWKASDGWRSGWIYNCKDACVTLESWKTLEKELRVHGDDKYMERVMDLVEPLTYLNLRGIRIDRPSISQFIEMANGRMKELQERMDKIAGERINMLSSKQLQTYFYVVKGVKPYYSRVTGAPTVNDEALKRLSRKGFEEADIIEEYRALNKLVGTYLDIKVDEDDRMRCFFNPAGTTTGRLSSSKTVLGTGTNLQNVPKDARAFFVADEGHILVEADLSQAEARVVAYLAGDPTMMMAFETGRDIHQISAELFGTTRRVAKTVNHASNYDMGYRKLSLLLGISEPEARILLEKYHAAYPGVRNVFHRGVQESLRRSRTLYNLFGRRRVFMDRMSDELLRQAYAYIPQSTVVEVINRGLVKMYRTGRFDLLLQVHDSILFQIRLDENVPARVLEAKDFIEVPLEVQGRRFVIPVEFKVGLNWKDMESIDVQSTGRLLDSLREVYGKLGISTTFSYLDRPVDNSGSPTAQSLS